MNISTDWILNIKKRFKFCSGWISSSTLSSYAEDCFRIGVLWLYKWRNMLKEQPKSGDIVVVRGNTDQKYYVCYYNSTNKSLTDVNTGNSISIVSTTEWKLIETEETLDKFNSTSTYTKDKCSGGSTNIDSPCCKS